MTVLNRKYTVSQMKKIELRNRGYFLSLKSRAFWGITEILPYKHSLFIINKDDITQTKKLYDVYLFIEEHEYENIWIMNKESFETKSEAKDYVKALQKFFETSLEVQDKEIIDNLSYPFSEKTGVIEFVNKEKNIAFKIKYDNGQFKKVNE